jgi:hypothetical protein
MLDFNVGLVKLGLRIFQLLCCLIGTALLGNVIAKNEHGAKDKNAAIGFCMAALVASWLAAAHGLVVRLYNSLENNWALLGADAFALFFDFIAATALSGLLGAVNCGALDPKKHSGTYIVWGSDSDVGRCRTLQGGAVFLWFLFFAFAPTAFLAWKQRNDVSIRSSSSVGRSTTGPMSEASRF